MIEHISNSSNEALGGRNHTNSVNNSHHKLVSPRLSSGKESSSFLLQCCDAKNLLKPTKVEGDIFTGSGMQADILASNPCNVSLLINIKRTMVFRCLPAGGDVEEERLNQEAYLRSDFSLLT